MQVIILCAGQSSRMEPISDKILLNFCWKTLLEHQIEAISSSGINDFIFVCNKNNIKEIWNICEKLKIKSKICEQKNLKNGMKWAIEACKNLVKKDVLIVNSNDIVDKELFKIIVELSEKKKYEAIICGKTVDKYFPWGYLSVDKNNLLTDIVEKPGEGNEPSNLVNLVIHYFNNFKEFTSIVENIWNSQDDAYEVALKKMCKTDDVYVNPYNGYWQAIKFPWHILQVQKYFLENLKPFCHKNTTICKNVIIKWNVYIEEGVKIFENSVISGPVYLGKNTIIANNCLIRESNIWYNSVIWFNTEIARSYLNKNIWTHLNYIWDSIIDENVSFGAWTITANLRLDEQVIKVIIKDKQENSQTNKLGSIIGKDCRIGVNCSISPGVKIGVNSFIWSGVNVQKNINKKSFVYMEPKLIIKENKRSVNTADRKKII